ncbi:MAG: hypothetical protein HFG43_05130 [Lachnospiraceae bacterium]|jgi:hypothetical protein|nr:hypothetical protein [Lachnospiraceae bacterium]
MANILQVTRPTPDIENRTLENRDPRNHINNQHIQNQVDPSRVVRADGQEKGGSNAAHDGNYSVIDYESNYGAFIQRLKDSGELPELLKQLLLEDSAGIIFGNQESVAGLVEQLFTSINVNSPEELLAFLQSQQAAQVKFSGSFFDGIRNILFQNASQGLKEAALAFLKGYNDYSSGEHLLLQMRSLTDDISRLMLKSYRGDFEALRDMINWRAPDGDTAANTEVLNGRLIPFLSRYISRTHDYGAVRDAVMFFVLHAVKYENGDKGRLAQLFDRLAGNREAERFFKNGLSDLDQVLEGIRSGQGKNAFADTFADLLLKGTGGQAGLENIQQFYNILNGMLLNESVYLPFLHIVLPFRYQGKDVMSEIWADPDAEKDPEEGGRRIKMFFRFDIRELGNFNMALSLQDRRMDMQLYVPPVLTQKAQEIQENISGILKKNGMDVNRLLVKEKRGEIRLEDVFPEIREKERTINVRI